MIEIRNILVDLKSDFHDKNLTWGAKASEYKNEFAETDDKISVLIELDLDIVPPENSIIIDHHNENAGIDQPTSIEQIAVLFGISLTRWQRLIAANDRGWIPAMKQAAASEEEIEKIRTYDRICQGVSEEMEQQAERICARIERTNHPVTVNFDYDNVSPITDSLYGKAGNILIYGPHSTTFSGDGKIISHLAHLYPDAFFGGELPARGFWGLARKEEKIQGLITKIWEELNDQKGFSQI
jgi:hypothetical protein